MRKMTAAIIVTLLFAGIFSAGMATADTINLKFAHFMSPMHIQHRMGFGPFCKKVAELTAGKVQIKIFPGGTLGGPKQLPDAVTSNITDISFIIPAYTTARFPRMSVLDLPFLFKSAEHTTRVIYDIYDQHLANDFKDYKVLWLYSGGPGQLMSINKPLKVIEDVEGMKMRTPSAYMSKALKLLKANPIGMPISKLTMSLQKKVIDGTAAPWSTITDFRMFDLIKHLTIIDCYTTAMAVVMNKDKFNSLPEYAQKAIDEAAGLQRGLEASKIYDQHDLNTRHENENLKKFEVYSMPAVEREKFIQRLKVMESDWVKEMSKKGLPAQEILTAVQAATMKY